MENHLTNQQFFVGGLVLFVVLLAAAVVIRYHKKKQLQFIRFFSLYDLNELDLGAYSESTFDESEDLNAFGQSPALAHGSQENVP